MFPPEEFVPQLRQVANDYGLLWIDDEIFTGIGRTGNWFAYRRHRDVHPDIICFDKAISNGVVPASGLVISGRMASVLEHYKWQLVSTFAASPIGMAALVGNLRFMLRKRLLPRVVEKDKSIRANMDMLKQRHVCVSRVD